MRRRAQSAICRQPQVLMLTTYEDSDLIFESLRAGANGYLLKNMPPAELIQAVEQVHAGGVAACRCRSRARWSNISRK